MSLHLFWGFLIVLVVVNTIGAVVTVFRDKTREIATVWAWLLVLILFPVIGFAVYFFFGRKLTNRRIFDLKTQEAFGIEQIVSNQARQAEEYENGNELTDDIAPFVKLFLNNDEAIVTLHNEVEIFTDGHEKFARLFDDIRAAKHHINIEYYTIYDDKLGNELVDLLTIKAREGVQVRVVYDLSGSGGRNNKLYRRLRHAGGQVEAFLIPRWQLISLNVNNHDHRKLVIIDGNIGYIGGFNIGDQYLGNSKKFGYWRDTHLRVEGDAVLAMQSRFFMDWNATIRHEKLNFSSEFFPSATKNGASAMQIVSSGPDTEDNQIFEGYLRMISMARERIVIQSPYFIPNQSIIDALRVAVRSGIKVQIMIPDMPDHAFVYRATQHFAREMVEVGAEVYTYDNGFIHAKTMVIDGKIAAVGTANMDFRSFTLNFEVSSFMYDLKIAEQLEVIFAQDLEVSTLLTKEYFDNQSSWMKIKQNFSRLLAPIM